MKSTLEFLNENGYVVNNEIIAHNEKNGNLIKFLRKHGFKLNDIVRGTYHKTTSYQLLSVNFDRMIEFTYSIYQQRDFTDDMSTLKYLDIDYKLV